MNNRIILFGKEKDIKDAIGELTTVNLLSKDSMQLEPNIYTLTLPNNPLSFSVYTFSSPSDPTLLSLIKSVKYFVVINEYIFNDKLNDKSEKLGLEMCIRELSQANYYTQAKLEFKTKDSNYDASIFDAYSINQFVKLLNNQDPIFGSEHYDEPKFYSTIPLSDTAPLNVRKYFLGFFPIYTPKSTTTPPASPPTPNIRS